MNTHAPCWLIVGQNPMSQAEIVHLLYEWKYDHKLIKFTSSSGDTRDAVLVLDTGGRDTPEVTLSVSPRPMVFYQDANGQVYAIDAHTGDSLHLGALVAGATASDLTGARYFTDPATGYHYVVPFRTKE